MLKKRSSIGYVAHPAVTDNFMQLGPVTGAVKAAGSSTAGSTTCVVAGLAAFTCTLCQAHGKSERQGCKPGAWEQHLAARAAASAAALLTSASAAARDSSAALLLRSAARFLRSFSFSLSFAFFSACGQHLA